MSSHSNVSPSSSFAYHLKVEPTRAVRQSATIRKSQLTGNLIQMLRLWLHDLSVVS